MNSDLPIRKARPPRALATPAVIHKGVVSCRITFDASNGPPLCAVLLPVAKQDGRWVIVDPHGAPIDVAGRADSALPAIDVLTSDAQALPRDGLATYDVHLALAGPWTNALLLLLHDQVERSGDDANFQERIKLELQRLQPIEVQWLEGKPPIGEWLTEQWITTVWLGKDVLAGQGPWPAIEQCMSELETSDLDRGIVTRRPTPMSANAPASRSNAFRFALASCQYPAGMLDNGARCDLDDPDLGGPAGRSLVRLARRVEADAGTRCAILCGDQVYVDATAGLFDAGTLIDQFAFAYDRMGRSRGLQGLLRTADFEVLPLLDDHEIGDNWEPYSGAKRRRRQRDKAEGIRYYLERQRTMWPPPASPAGRLWEARAIAGYDFFFADTRTERIPRTVAGYESIPIMGCKQADALHEWILARGGAGAIPAFVVSASMLLPRPLALVGRPAMALHADSWCGYPRSLYRVLASLHESDARRIVFLSGDEHISCAARIKIERPRDGGRAVATHSIHSSALYAPYPFANSRSDDFAGDESFEFEHDGAYYRCTVQTDFLPPSDGFALLDTYRDRDGWKLEVEFDLNDYPQSYRFELG